MKKKDIIENWKKKVIATKSCRDRGKITLSSKDKENYKNNTVDDNTNPDQADNKNPVPGCNNFSTLAKHCIFYFFFFL